MLYMKDANLLLWAYSNSSVRRLCEEISTLTEELVLRFQLYFDLIRGKKEMYFNLHITSLGVVFS